MSNFCGTTICVFITVKLSSDLNVEIRRTWEDSSMKVPCRITGSSYQDFDFEVSCNSTNPKGETSSWLADSFQNCNTTIDRSISIHSNGENMLFC